MHNNRIGFICRLQPLHNGHINVINHALALTDDLVIMIGSTNSARTIKNPFTYKERISMVLNSIPVKYHSSIKFRQLHDNFYNELGWTGNVYDIMGDRNNTSIISSNKTDDDYKRRTWLPIYDHISVPVDKKAIHGTDIRNAYLSDGIISDDVPDSVKEFLKTFRDTDEFNYLYSEYHAIRDRRKPIEDLLNKKLLSYDVISQTVDALVISKGHILLVKRKQHPGKNLWALPGGYLEVDETIKDGMLRELKEETQIDISSDILKACIVIDKIFDYPYRSSLGRVITNASVIKLDTKVDEDLPMVKAADDAAGVKWFPLPEFESLENKMFDDHYQIIQYFINIIEEQV